MKVNKSYFFVGKAMLRVYQILLTYKMIMFWNYKKNRDTSLKNSLDIEM